MAIFLAIYFTIGAVLYMAYGRRNSVLGRASGAP
jgi:hypothetical protein